MRHMSAQRGLGIVALMVLLTLSGAMLTWVLPFFLPRYNQSMENTELRALEAARTAVISYALQSGSMPEMADPNPQCLAGVMPNTLDVNHWSVFSSAAGGSVQNPFCMDINDALQGVTPSESIPAQRNLCQTAREELAADAIAPVLGPRICHDRPCADAAAAVAPTSTAVAFVIYSTGNNRRANLNHLNSSRLYENDLRGISHAPNAAMYDDQLVSYSLTQLIKDCGSLPTPAVETCGTKIVTVSTSPSSNQSIYYFDANNVCTLAAAKGGNTSIPFSLNTCNQKLYKNKPCQTPVGGNYLSNPGTSVSCTGNGKPICNAQ